MDDMERLKRLRDLGRLAELAWQADAARFAALRRQDDDAVDRIAALRAGLAAWDGAPVDARYPRAEARWQAWTGCGISDANLLRSRLHAEIEAGRPGLARSFGRKEVLRRLLGKAAAARRPRS